MPSNTPPIYCPHNYHTSLSYPSKDIRTSSQHRPNALRSFSHPIKVHGFITPRSSFFPSLARHSFSSPSNSSLFVPHSSLKSSPLPIHPSNSSHQIPHILYIIRCNRTKPLRRKGKFSAEKATKRVFFPFQALVCRRPHICPSTFSKMSLHFVPPPVPPVTKIDNISSILPLIRKPLESHSKTVRTSSESYS